MWVQKTKNNLDNLCYKKLQMTLWDIKHFFEYFNIKDFNLKSKQNESSYYMMRLKEAKSKNAVEVTMLHLQNKYLTHHHISLHQAYMMIWNLEVNLL